MDTTNTTKQPEQARYQCEQCKHTMFYEDIKNNIKCTNCSHRILTKLRSEKISIEYKAR